MTRNLSATTKLQQLVVIVPDKCIRVCSTYKRETIQKAVSFDVSGVRSKVTIEILRSTPSGLCQK